jgi:hypothetical protein
LSTDIAGNFFKVARYFFAFLFGGFIDIIFLGNISRRHRQEPTVLPAVKNNTKKYWKTFGRFKKKPYICI